MKRYTIAQTIKIDGVRYHAGDEFDESEIPKGNLASMLRLGQAVESRHSEAAKIVGTQVEQQAAEIKKLRATLVERERYGNEDADEIRGLRAENARLRDEIAAEKLKAELKAAAEAEPVVPPTEVQTSAPTAEPTPAGPLVGPPGDPPTEPKPVEKPADPKHKRK